MHLGQGPKPALNRPNRLWNRSQRVCEVAMLSWIKQCFCAGRLKCHMESRLQVAAEFWLHGNHLPVSHAEAPGRARKAVCSHCNPELG